MSVVPHLKLAVLLSGGGTTFKNLVAERQAGRLDVSFVRVISSSPHAGGLQIAARAGIPSEVIERGSFRTTESFSEQVFEICRRDLVDLIVLGGFLKHLLIPPDFVGRVMNIHPSLIPAFCGKGFYGHFVHEGVLAYGAKVSGCTVHFVDNEYDHGPIVLQRPVLVLEGDSPESLAARVFAEECIAYPEAIRLFAAGRLQIEGRLVHVRSESSPDRVDP